MLVNIRQRFWSLYLLHCATFTNVSHFIRRRTFIKMTNFPIKKFLADYDNTFDNPFTILWILSSVISSCYAYAWDIKMDWGLFDKNANENKFLREEIVYSSTVSRVAFQWKPFLVTTSFFHHLVFLLFCYNRRFHSSIYMGVGILSNRIQIR